MIENADESVWYAPDIDDNRSLPEGDRFAVRISPMSAAEYRRAEDRLGMTKLGRKVNFTARYNAMREEALRKHVLEVRGLRVTRSRNGERTAEEIRDVNGLLGLANPQAREAIAEDIYSAVKDHSLLEDGLLGKSV